MTDKDQLDLFDDEDYATMPDEDTDIEETNDPDGNEDEGGEEHVPVDDEGDEEIASPDEVDDVQLQAEKPTRGSKRIQELANQKTEAEKRAAAAETRLREIEVRAQQEEARRQQAVNENEAEAYQRMTPEEQIRHDLAKLQAQRNYDQQMARFNEQQATDRAQYDAKASVNPVYKKYASQVETELAKLHKQGMTLPREAIVRYIIGDAYMKQTEKNSKPVAPQKTRKVAKATNSRGDVSGTQTKRNPSSEQEKRRQRLENQSI